MGLKEEALKFHCLYKGKIEIKSKVPLQNIQDLSLAYTPGVAEPCKEISQNVELVYKYTGKGNLVAIITDGTAVLGLGDIGPEAALPVMEGKAVLFKHFGGVDAFPLCLKTREVEEIVQFVKWLEPTIGGVNLEDIAAPRCFELEKRLITETNIPIFHDDQHGTAIVVTAAMLNALRLTGKKIESIKVVISGAGAAGIACTRLLLRMGVKSLIVCDRQGAIYEGRAGGLNPFKEEIAKHTNREKICGGLREAIRQADVFIGVSMPGIVTKEMVKSMNQEAIVFAMANPVPEIYPEEAKAGGARIVGTGRSDFPNQINNVLAFPGVFRGALDVRARAITEEMKIAAAYAIASLVSDTEVKEDYIIPNPFDLRVAPAVAKAVATEAVSSGIARKTG